MATMFSAFRSSSMPKRLLRYALSKIELLDADAIDMDNLDLAIGRNTVLEFRDVGIKLKKLERILNLPSSFKLRKARVVLLRVTIPVDIYSSPITVEVQGVDVRLSVSDEKDDGPIPSRQSSTAGGTEVVPNTVDLAASFLEQQPDVEKKELEEALAAETHDMGASISGSDDGSEDESSVGTGQPLSLPAFLTDFLQGVVDRTQVTIRTVTFQLDIDIPVEQNTQAAADAVTFEIALEGINVEGVTASDVGDDGAPLIVPREGKRHISLSNIRAYLVSEANVFSAFARSPSMASPAVPRSPAHSDRSPLSREGSSLSQRYDDYLQGSNQFGAQEYPMGDSEAALGIPYDFSTQQEDDDGEENPATPKASVFQTFHPAPSLPRSRSEPLRTDEEDEEDPPWGSIHEASKSTPAPRETSGSASGEQQSDRLRTTEPSPSPTRTDSSGSDDDLTQSHIYTHEEAASMYASAMSAFPEEPTQPSMPGAWMSSPDSSPQAAKKRSPSPLPVETEARQPQPEPEPAAVPDVVTAAPAEEAVPQVEADEPSPEALEERPASPPQDETPRGPTRLVKEIVSLKNISIYVPSTHKHIHVHQTGAPTSEPEPQVAYSQPRTSGQRMPGAFSVYSTHELASSASIRPSASSATATQGEGPDNSLEVVFSPLEVRFDASLGFLIATVISKLLEAAKDGGKRSPAAAATTRPTSDESETKPPLPEIKIVAEKVSFLFLHHLMGVADTPERILNPSAFEFDHEVLLRADVEDFTISTQKPEGPFNLATTIINFGKFRFGYANGKILSFDRSDRMGASIRDVFPPGGADVSVKLVSGKKFSKAEITTLTLMVNLDLQRLDETFGWFGGLSSFLNMGASMSSSASPSTRTLPPPPPPPRARAVRFNTPISPDDKSAALENKVDMRVGGLNVRLSGTQCDILLETSAVKMVARAGGIGVAITSVSLSGPYLRSREMVPPVRVDVEGTRLEYRYFPDEHDLEKLLKLIAPSKAQPDLEDDEIMVDTLLRQRRKGAVLRVTLDTVRARAGDLEHLSCLPTLEDEIARLATVAKYLPEDDRPGLLCLGRFKTVNVTADTGTSIGVIKVAMKEFNLAQITIPSLVAIGLDQLSLIRNENEVLVSSADKVSDGDKFVVTARMIGDEIEPVIKIRLDRLAFEYRVPTVMEFLGLGDDATPQDFENELAMSMANLGEQAHATLTRRQPSPTFAASKGKDKQAKPLMLQLSIKDCLIGLNPMGLLSKMTIALTDSRLEVVLPKDDSSSGELEIKKAAILLIDDVSILETNTASSRRRRSTISSQQVSELCARGYVEICYISAAKARVCILDLPESQKKVEVSLRDDLLVLETCADSTQTLISLANALKPPTPPSKQNKFRTKVMPVKDLLASISAEAFGRAEGDYDFDDDFAMAQEFVGFDEAEDIEGDLSQLEIQENFYADDTVGEKLFDATDSIMSVPSQASGASEGLVAASPARSIEVESEDSGLVVHEDWFGKDEQDKGTAQVWNSKRSRYDKAPADIVERAPLKVTVRDVHVIWNLFDGYDWSRTQDVITKKVQEIEAKAYEKRARTEAVFDEEVEDEEAVVGDFLFNSIYIEIPANRDPRELTRAINQHLQDNATETESVATTSHTTSTVRPGGSSRSGRKLRLNRSKRHKITFELQGVDVDLIAFPPDSGETEASIDVRVKNLDIFDHVPTSTWKKFATYDQDAGEREMGSSMVHLEMLNVRPNKDLAAIEHVLRVTVLPVRLHVDQDALDFITRFFEFKDPDAAAAGGGGGPSQSDVPFVQRAEINPIPLKLDFKPKRVDYAGLRSGRTNEFMNFIILEEARMTLRRAIIFGVQGFDRLGKVLNDVWMPDVKQNQLPGVLAGLAPVRGIVNVGSGFRELIEVPIREYKKDGRIIRSVAKGATTFVRTTGTELVKLGAKLAVGTQSALQGAEGMLTTPPANASSSYQQQQRHGTDDDGSPEGDSETDEPKQVSLYSDPPANVLQGIRGGYRALARDINMARDAIIAVPGAVMESDSAQGAAKAVLRRAPTIIFRPAIGATKAIGQTLMGATNTIDPENRRRVDEKYKPRY